MPIRFITACERMFPAAVKATISLKYWNEMILLHTDLKGSLAVKSFLERVKRGLNQALEQTGTVLIVAHGEVHWAICHWMNIEGHSWIIDS